MVNNNPTKAVGIHNFNCGVLLKILWSGSLKYNKFVGTAYNAWWKQIRFCNFSQVVLLPDLGSDLLDALTCSQFHNASIF